jgi:hypothetical protein
MAAVNKVIKLRMIVNIQNAEEEEEEMKFKERTIHMILA